MTAPRPNEAGYWRPRQSAADDIADVMTRLLLRDVSEDLAWQDKALCAEADPDAFFPEKGGDVRAAKSVCMACSVRRDCLEYALTRNELYGIWGGKSERQRRNLRRAGRQAAA